MQGTTFGAVLALTAACSPSATHQAGTTSGGHGGTAGHGGASGSTGPSASSSTVASSAVSTGVGGNGGAGSGGAGNGGAGGGTLCNPAAPAGSLYATQGLRYPDFVPESMCQYRGDVLLILNTAAV
jgi:hypothetical protein